MRADEAIVSVLGSTNFPLAFFGLTRNFDESPFTEKDLIAAERIRATLERQMSRIVRSNRENNPINPFLNILYEIIPDPCALVDSESRPFWANRAAVNKLKDDLWQLEDGCFIFSNSASKDRWRNAVQRAENCEAANGISQDGIVVNRIERNNADALYFIRETTAPSKPEKSWRTLSTREWEIARLAAQGYTSVNIGAELAIFEGTVRNHLKKIYRKLQISSRVELAISLGLTK